MESSNAKSNYKEHLIYPLPNQNTHSSNIITPQSGIYGFENEISSPKIVSKDSNTFLLNDHPLDCNAKCLFVSALVMGFLIDIVIFTALFLTILNEKKIEYYIILSVVIGFLMSLLFIMIGLANLTYKKVLKLGDKSIAITRKKFFCCKKTKVYSFGELKELKLFLTLIIPTETIYQILRFI